MPAANGWVCEGGTGWVCGDAVSANGWVWGGAWDTNGWVSAGAASMRWEPADNRRSSSSSLWSAVARFGAAEEGMLRTSSGWHAAAGSGKLCAIWVGPANGWGQRVAADGGGADELDPDVSAAGGVDAAGGGVGGVGTRQRLVLLKGK